MSDEKLLTLENGRVRMRVKLTHPDPSYRIGPGNPKVGTKYECEGVVEYVGGSVDVRWDNGHTNNYKEGELTILDYGICVSIWEGIG